MDQIAGRLACEGISAVAIRQRGPFVDGDATGGGNEASVEGGREQTPPRSERQAKERDADAEANERVVEHQAVPPIGWEIAGVATNLLGIVRDLAVQRGVRQLDPQPPEEFR